MVAQGYGLPVIGRALNHARITTTQRYAHLDVEPVRLALETTALAMFGPAREAE
jgi:site-specific recombinase XerD